VNAPLPGTGLCEQGAELFCSFDAPEQVSQPFGTTSSHKGGDNARMPAARQPSLFKPIRGIVRGTDSRYPKRAQHMKKHAETIEIKY
jgi:hypothetical protein